MALIMEKILCPACEKYCDVLDAIFCECGCRIRDLNIHKKKCETVVKIQFFKSPHDKF